MSTLYRVDRTLYYHAGALWFLFMDVSGIDMLVAVSPTPQSRAQTFGKRNLRRIFKGMQLQFWP
jgi:hypothetical protein